MMNEIDKESLKDAIMGIVFDLSESIEMIDEDKIDIALVTIDEAKDNLIRLYEEIWRNYNNE